MKDRVVLPGPEPNEDRRIWEAADARIREMSLDRIAEELVGLKKVTDTSYIPRDTARAEIKKLEEIREQAAKVIRQLKET